MFKKIYDVKYSDIDVNGVLKLPILLGYLEDVAAKHADALDFGYQEITTKNFGWFLLKYAVEFYQYPKNIFTIKISTESRGANKLFAYRDFYIYDEKDILLGKVASTWALVDLENKTMQSPLKIFHNITNFEKQENDITYEKIPPISENKIEKTFNINFYDIDVNKHVNNVKYVTWALETLPLDYLTGKTIQRLDINYKKEIRYGNIIRSNVSYEDKFSVHSIKNNDTEDELFLMKVVFQ